MDLVEFVGAEKGGFAGRFSRFLAGIEICLLLEGVYNYDCFVALKPRNDGLYN